MPSWRRDIGGAPDLVEEVTRITGFDAIASVRIPHTDGVAKPTATPRSSCSNAACAAATAAAARFDEAVTWSFISESDAAPFGGAFSRSP